jgi:hypothetical protein
MEYGLKAIACALFCYMWMQVAEKCDEADRPIAAFCSNAAFFVWQIIASMYLLRGA